MRNESRSYGVIERSDLLRLREIARDNHEEFFARRPRCATLKNRVVCIALCQGAALHYLDRENGIKDFDVWTFYASLPDIQFPPRWRVEKDFGNAKFGKSKDAPHFVGRRVDLLGRSLDILPDAQPIQSLRTDLSEGKTETARQLSQKAVILLHPLELVGKIVWPSSLY